MGSIFGSPPKPRPDPKLQEQKANQQKINAEESARLEREKQNHTRKLAGNMIGQKSLQGDDMEGFGGYRRKNMGSKTV